MSGPAQAGPGLGFRADARRPPIRLLSPDGKHGFISTAKETRSWAGATRHGDHAGSGPLAARSAAVDFAPSRQDLQMGGADYVMEEIGVMNGTFVNDCRSRPATPVPIADGDTLKFGLVALQFKTTA